MNTGTLPDPPLPALDAAWFDTEYDGQTYHVLDDEFDRMFGHGHDAEAFAAECNRYLKAIGSIVDDETELVHADDVSKLWAVTVPSTDGDGDAIYFGSPRECTSPVTAHTPAAFPIMVVHL